MTSFEQLKMHSPNLVDANIDKVASLFPNCITEAQDEHGIVKKAIDFDLLRQELSHVLVEGDQERYRLDWPGKKQAILNANSPIAMTLRPCREESVNFDTTQNLFIEGDNLDALKLLQENYLGKVKMIYIDPPYNTGNDFIYNDDFAESTEEFFEKSHQIDEDGNRLVSNTESNGRFHSDWLSMIYGRLKLARNLLKEDGLIFISIDDKEVHNLRKVLDEIMGSDNFVADLIWEKRFTRNNDAKLMSFVTDHILLYRKSSLCSHLREPRNEKNNSIYSNPDNDPRGVWTSVSYISQRTKEERPNLAYEMMNPHGETIVHPVNAWKYSKDQYLKHVQENRLHWGKDGNNQFPRLKRFLSELSEGVVPINLWKYDETGTTDDATKEVTQLIGKDIFDYPKPTSLIQRMLRLINDKNAIVLDFFSGSGTTAHSVYKMNLEDSGNRKFITVQLPEITDLKSQAYKAGYKTIAEISKKRIRRAGQKILTDNADKEGIENLDIGFRVLKVDSSNMKDVYYTPDSLKKANLDFFESNIKEDRTDEDLLFQVMLDWGLELSLPIEPKQIADKTVYFVAENSLVACFQPLSMELIDQIAQYKPLRFVSAERSIVNDHDKTNIRERFKQLSPETDVKFL